MNVTKSTMNIPVDADGIVDDQNEFEAMMAENEAKLSQEIENAKGNDEYDVFQFEDLKKEFVINRNIAIMKGSFKRFRRKAILAKNS